MMYMEQGDYLHLIGLGDSGDWEAGSIGLYYMEDKNGEKYLPVFTTPEQAARYVRATFGAPKAHMDMLESVPASHVGPLTEGRFVVMSLDTKGVAEAAAMIDADYMLRDPRSGEQQQILRLDK
jgi:hypothetical protein